MSFREYDVAEETTGSAAIDRATLTAIYGTKETLIIFKQIKTFKLWAPFYSGLHFPSPYYSW